MSLSAPRPVPAFVPKAPSDIGRVVATSFRPVTLDQHFLEPSEMGEVDLPDLPPRRALYEPDPSEDTWDEAFDEPSLEAIPLPRRRAARGGSTMPVVAGLVLAAGASAAAVFGAVLGVGMVAIGLLVAVDGGGAPGAPADAQADWLVMPAGGK